MLAVAFLFFHLSCILLLVYKPGPKFAIRSMKDKPSEEEVSLLTKRRLVPLMIAGTDSGSRPRNMWMLQELTDHSSLSDNSMSHHFHLGTASVRWQRAAGGA